MKRISLASLTLCLALQLPARGEDVPHYNAYMQAYRNSQLIATGTKLPGCKTCTTNRIQQVQAVDPVRPAPETLPEATTVPATTMNGPTAGVPAPVISGDAAGCATCSTGHRPGCVHRFLNWFRCREYNHNPHCPTPVPYRPPVQAWFPCKSCNGLTGGKPFFVTPHDHGVTRHAPMAPATVVPVASIDAGLPPAPISKTPAPITMTSPSDTVVIERKRNWGKRLNPVNWFTRRDHCQDCTGGVTLPATVPVSAPVQTVRRPVGTQPEVRPAAAMSPYHSASPALPASASRTVPVSEPAVQLESPVHPASFMPESVSPLKPREVPVFPQSSR